MCTRLMSSTCSIIGSTQWPGPARPHHHPPPPLQHQPSPLHHLLLTAPAPTPQIQLSFLLARLPSSQRIMWGWSWGDCNQERWLAQMMFAQDCWRSVWTKWLSLSCTGSQGWTPSWSKPPLQRVNIRGEDIEVVQSYRYLGVHLDSKLDWSVNTDAVYRKGQSRLFFLRRLRSFDICGEMLHMFYQSVVASTIFYAAVCWGGSAT